MAAAHVKKYNKCLIDDFSKKGKVKKVDTEVTTDLGGEVSTDLTDEQTDMVMRAYHDIMLACSDNVNFGIVFNSKSIIFPEGDAYMAWTRLKQKHEPQTNAQKVMLRKAFHQSRLKKNEDPDEWVENMHGMMYRLQGLGVDITEQDLVLQILEGLPSTYDPLVILLNDKNKKGELTVAELREELTTLYDRQSRRNKKKHDGSDDVGNEETALFASTFKGRCRGCGEHGHKKADCPKERQSSNNSSANNSRNWNNGRNRKFGGKCHHCGKPGHKKADCWTLKRQQERANVISTADEPDDEEFAFIACVDCEDIIDYDQEIDDNCDDDFQEVSTTSWSKVSYWSELSDSAWEDISLSTNASDNRYHALCCWESDDESDDEDEEEPEVDTENDVSTLEMTDTITAVSELESIANYDNVSYMASEVENDDSPSQLFEGLDPNADSSDEINSSEATNSSSSSRGFWILDPRTGHSDVRGYALDEFDVADRETANIVTADIAQAYITGDISETTSSEGLYASDDSNNEMNIDSSCYWGPSEDNEHCYPSAEVINDAMNENIWLGDTGASSHMTMSMIGMQKIRKSNATVTVGNGERMKVHSIGDFVGQVEQKDGTKKAITLKNVKYVPDLNCNLLSLTQAIDNGFNMTGNKDGLWIRKGAMTYAFDYKFQSGSGVLMGMSITDNNLRTALNGPTRRRLKASKMHNVLGHTGEPYTRATSARLGIDIQGPIPPCPSCAISKMKQSNTRKLSADKATERGERLCMDISSVKDKSSGGSKYWLMVIDEATRFQWSYFIPAKKKTRDKILSLLKHLKSQENIDVKNIRCDDAGENVATKTLLDQEGYGINFEFTSKGTPQHNGIVERRFATLYGRIRSMLHGCGCPEKLKYKLWAECANTSGDLFNIQTHQADHKSPYEAFYGTLPPFARNLRTFGQLGVVLSSSISQFKAKLKSRGVVRYFVGYAKNHAHDVYRMYNKHTGRVSVTRDIRWLDKQIGDDRDDDDVIIATLDDDDDDDDTTVSGRDDAESDADDDGVFDSKDDDDGDEATQDDETDDVSNNDASSFDYEDNDDRDTDNSEPPATQDISDEEDDNEKTMNPKTTRELRRLQTWYNPTLTDMGEVAFVGGTDDLYENPEKFQGAWNHPEEVERKQWRLAILKEFKDMEEKKVWRKFKIADIPKDRRLIGCRWVNKRKRNGVYRARLVALGYSQIPGVDFTESFAPVILDVTFRLICFLILWHDWIAEIVDIETAFLYGDLKEEIFMKIPPGYEVVVNKQVNREKECVLLIKTIYGLSQSARQFYKKLSYVLTEKLKMQKCLSDQCLFFRKTAEGPILIAIYIDDTLCVGSQKAVDELKKDIAKHFSTKEEGTMTEYVGCEVRRTNRKSLSMCQTQLIQKLQRIFGEQVKHLSRQETPAPTGFSVMRCTEPNELISLENQRMYRSGVGILLFLVKYSRPDISNAVRELSKANDGATKLHLKCLMRTIKYVLDSKDMSLEYRIGNKIDYEGTWKIKAYCDSDFAGDKEKRISVSGYCIYLMGCLVAWKSKGQKHVTLSSTEAEFVAVSDVCTEIMFIRMILEFLGIRVKLPIIVHCDNIGAIFLSYNAKISQRTKHIDTKYRYVGEYVEQGVVKIVFVRSENNKADILTKNTSRDTYLKHVQELLSRISTTE